jgi:hypothetical protein
MLQTGGCHFDKWIVPSERNRPDSIRRDLIDWVKDNLFLGRNQANNHSFFNESTFRLRIDVNNYKIAW